MELASEPQARIRSALNKILDAYLDETRRVLAGLPVRGGGLGVLDSDTVVTPSHVVVSFPALLLPLLAAYHRASSARIFTALAVLSQSSTAQVTALRTLLRVGHSVTTGL